MSDRGPYGQDSDPTEVFPPLRPDPPTPPATLPPVGIERDPDPTRVMQPGEPMAVPPTGGPYDPGPPYGGGGSGGGGGGGGGGEPPFEPEPEPWYRQPGPVAALIAGIAALVVAVIALVIWTSGGDDSSNDTLPSVASSVPATTTSSSTTTTTEPATTTSSSTTTSTSSTTTSTTTTTLPPTTTTTTTPPTTAAPTTTTTTTPITNPPPGVTAWDVISATPSLSSFKTAITGSGTEGFFQGTKAYTVLAPDNDAMKNVPNSFDVTDYVTEGTISSADLFQMQEIAMQSGVTLKIDNATQTVGGAVMTASRDIKVSNGVIHVLAGLVSPG